MDDVISRGSRKPRCESSPGQPDSEIINQMSGTESFATVSALPQGWSTGSSVEMPREKEVLFIIFSSRDRMAHWGSGSALGVPQDLMRLVKTWQLFPT